MDGDIWGDANVTFPDWKGTAQLDERMTTPWEGLARTFGLDPDRWQVVGFSIGGGEHGHDLRIVAAPQDVWARANSDDNAEIEVTEFLVHNVDPFDVLKRMTHVFELKMTLRHVDGQRVRVRTLSDLPTELFVTEQFGPQED